ncbi:MAG TPA: MFS transporter [Thermomicrobiaceae bacterium]|nr:MFS transporter [Thermomicrobiaceae bacterium]
MRTMSAYQVYLIICGASALFFATIATVTGVYLVTVAHFSPFELLLVGTVLETTCFLMELPTGIVADVYSRRLSVIIGLALIGLGFMLEGSIPRLAPVLVAQVIWGVGATFVSGAQEAWIADELGQERIGRVYLRGAQAGQLGALLGIGLSVALASLHIGLAIVIGGALHVALALWLLAIMPERHFQRAEQGSHNPFRAMRATASGGLHAVRGRPVLITILAIGAFFGASSEAFDRLWEAHFLTDIGLPSLGGLPFVVWFGIITAGGMLLSIGATEIARRRVDSDSHAGAARALLAINTLMLAGTLAFGLAQGFAAALAAYWMVRLLRRTSVPIYTAWVNQGINPRVRATVLSLASQTDALGQIAGGPLLGLIGSAVSIPAALVSAGLLLLPATPLFARTLRHGEPTVPAGELEG